jgi:hypothetical protein
LKTLLFICCLAAGTAKAQDTLQARPSIQLSGYVEAYYGYDFNQPDNQQRPAFLYNHNRHNEFNLNLGYLKAAWQTEQVRANLALAAGTYMNANYTAEPGVLKNVLEANAGIRLSRKKNLWLDAGVMPSHIGFESAISKDCYTLTRSLVAENSPYFETGAKLSYGTVNQRWQFGLLALNGWQRIQRQPHNSLVSLGMQVQYTSPSGTILNYSNFIGSDQPDSARKMRYYHNFYGSFSWNKMDIQAGIDWGMQQSAKSSGSYQNWLAPVLVVRYRFVEHWSLSARAEYFSDPKSTLISTANANGFKVSGFSANLDYAPVDRVKCRIEFRRLGSREAIFPQSDSFMRANTAITGSIAVSF